MEGKRSELKIAVIVPRFELTRFHFGPIAWRDRKSESMPFAIYPVCGVTKTPKSQNAKRARGTTLRMLSNLLHEDDAAFDLPLRQTIAFKENDAQGRWLPRETWSQILHESNAVDPASPFKFALLCKSMHKLAHESQLMLQPRTCLANVPIDFAALTEERAQNLIAAPPLERCKMIFSRYLDSLANVGGNVLSGVLKPVLCFSLDETTNFYIDIANQALFSKNGGKVVCWKRNGKAGVIHFPRFIGDRRGQVFFFAKPNTITAEFWHNLALDAAAHKFGSVEC